MRAEVKQIVPNNRTLEWDEIAPRVDPQANFGSFYVDVGVEGDPASDMFIARVATPAAASRARKKGESDYRGHIVQSFDAETIKRTIGEYVSSVIGPDWQTIVDVLRQRMDWEFEGMTPL